MREIFGGMCLLAVAMGIGRFSYTPLLPLMQAEYGLTNSMAGFIALSNYIGYFVGSLLCTCHVFKKQRMTLNCMILIGALSLGIVGLTADSWLLLFARFISGVTSAVIFIFTTQMILTHIQRLGKGCIRAATNGITRLSTINRFLFH